MKPSVNSRRYRCPETVRIGTRSWYEVALQRLDKHQAAQIMNCSARTAEEQTAKANRAMQASLVLAIGTTGSPALEALARFLQSSAPVHEKRIKMRLDRFYAQ